MSNTLCREALYFSKIGYSSRLMFLKVGIPQRKYFSILVFLKAGTLKSASLFDAVAHTDAVTQISCEGERWILRLDGSNGCKSLY